MRKFLLIFLFILLVPAALGAPESYIEENVYTEFFRNGTVRSSQKIGRVSIVVGNNQDVLQYIELNLTNITNTNLNTFDSTQKSLAYRGTAASVTGEEKTLLFLNTSYGEEELEYILDEDVAPVINITMDYMNKDGGLDVHNGLNTFNFSADIITTHDLENVYFYFQANRLGADAINITYFSSSGTAFMEADDTNSNGIYDRFEWLGDLSPGNPVTIYFEGEIIPGINFDESFAEVNLEGECEANNTIEDGTFSGIRFSERFSRGPIREGIDLSQEYGGWTVTGFIKNMANGLVYRVHGWEIYEVGNPIPVANSTDYFQMYPGTVNYTSKHITGETEKKYYSPSFDWEIIWSDSYYRAETENRVEMPILYFIDSVAEKFITIEQNSQDGRIIGIRDKVQHSGHSMLNVTEVYINSKLPHLSDNGHATTWTISDISVLLRRGGNETDITSLVNLDYSDSTPTNDGYINIDFSNSDIGGVIRKDDDVVLSYKISTSCQDQDHNYTFSTNTTLKTESGTPETNNVSEKLEITGVFCGEEPSPGGGGGGITAPKKEEAGIMKEDSRIYVEIGNMVNSNVLYRIYDTGTKGIRDIENVILIPENGELVEGEVSVKVLRNGSWFDFKNNIDYRIKSRGLVSIGDKKYNQYIVEYLSNQGLDLHNGDKIKIEYVATLPYGQNELITEASGYNYYEDKIVIESVHSFIRITAKITKFQYTKSEWEQGLANVGKPVMWIREFLVKNPNDSPARDLFTASVFMDSLNVHIVDENGQKEELEIKPGNLVEWYVTLNPKEEKRLYLQVFTPPVLEISKKITPLFSNDSWVNFEMNSTVRNFAKESYKKVNYELPFPLENVKSYEGLEDIIKNGGFSSAVIGDMNGNETKSFYINYIQKPPILIVNLNKYNFTFDETLEANIIVIPTENEELGYLEIEAIGPKPNKKTNFGNAMNVEGKKGSINEFEEQVKLSNFVPGKYRFVTHYKKDFVTVLRDEKEFYVGGKELLFEIGYNMLLLLLFLFILFMFIRIKEKEDKFKKDLKKLRKKGGEKEERRDRDKFKEDLKRLRKT